MESRVLKALVVLGVPGVALGVFYLLLRQFGFSFSTIGAGASAGIAVLFLVIVGGVILFALHRWAPQRSDKTTVRDLKLPNGSRFTDAQFETYRGVWVALQELRATGDALWTRVTQKNLDAFVRALRVAKAQIAAGAIFFDHDDYEQLTALLQHFADYYIGKERLIKMKTRREGGRRWEPWVQQQAEQQIGNNQQYFTRYTALLDKMRTRYHDHLAGRGQTA
jgi:hypothetical protein